MAQWSVVIPVKRLARAKSRLRGAVPGVPHEELVLSLAADTVAAAVASPGVAGVLVVTDDPVVRATARELGAASVADVPDAGLNPALAYGAERLAARHPYLGVAALGADLPALRPDELAGALSAAAGHRRAYACDADGTGTVLLTAAPGVALVPRFGAGSARAHAADGAVELAGAWPSLRRDVDTAADLRAAAELGLGVRTGQVLLAAGAAAGQDGGMQATVATFDPENRSGTALLDDGSEVSFGTAAFDASPLRYLRLGQRITLQHDPDGTVVRVTLPTLP